MQHLATMKRVMVNLDDVTGEMLEQRADSERRSASSYVAILIDRDLRAAGLIPSDDLKARLIAAGEDVGLEAALDAVVSLKAGKKKRKAA